MRRRRAILGGWASLALVLALLLAPASAARAVCDPSLVEQDVRSLASSGMEGRGLGTAGLEQALHLVARRFKGLGLQPAYPVKDGLLEGYL